MPDVSVITDSSTLNRLTAGVRTLNPGYFAIVMASGIISVGLHDQLSVVSAALLWFAVVSYAVLAVLSAWRLVAFRARMDADLADPRRAFGFFTFVAGSGVIGTRLLADGHRTVALAMLALAGLAWLLLAYAVPVRSFGATAKPVAIHSDGTWFLWVVATQSVAVLAGSLEPMVSTGRKELALLAVFCWSVGSGLYLIVAGMIIARLTLFEFRGHQFTPSYWISTGATAITVLAGATILQMTSDPTLRATRTVVAGGSVMFWTFGTWLIPPLVAVGWYRHRRGGIPLTYDPGWWSIVFPLGMYAVATRRLGSAESLPLLDAIGRYEQWVAVAAWVLTFAALCWHLARPPSGSGRLRRPAGS